MRVLLEHPVEAGRSLPDPANGLPDLGGRAVAPFGIDAGRAGDDAGGVGISRKEPLQQLSERIDVRPDVRGGKSVLLGRGDPLGSDQLRVARLSLDVEFCGVIVDDLDETVIRQHDVGGLKVPVDDRRVGAVQEGQAVADLRQDADALLEGQAVPSFREDLLQRLALDQLLDNDQLVPVLPERFDLRDIAAPVGLQPVKNLRVEDGKTLLIEKLSGCVVAHDRAAVLEGLNRLVEGLFT